MTTKARTAGQILADTLRANFGIGTRTSRYGKVFGHQFAALLGRMVDAKVETTGDGERYFQNMAREIRTQAAA